MNDTPTQVGRYRLERELGRGAMGVVYQAFDPLVERHVAIKTMRLDGVGNGELLELLKREAKSVGKFEHPNIVTLYDAGEADGLFYMVMQLVQGETLRDRIGRQRWYKIPQIVDIFRQILTGLHYAHERGVVHRDIKPANIMVSSDGLIKLADFGIAKAFGPGASSSGLVVGTPSYMSPEQILSRPVDARSDIFSVGCTLYELLTGEKAYSGDTATAVMYKIVHQSVVRPSALRPGLDGRLEEIVLKALANDPDDRFQTCSEMAKAIENCLGAMEENVSDIPPAVHTPPPRRLVKTPALTGQGKRRARIWKVGVASATLIAVLTLVAVIIARWPAHTTPVTRQPNPKAEIRPPDSASALPIAVVRNRVDMDAATPSPAAPSTARPPEAAPKSRSAVKPMAILHVSKERVPTVLRVDPPKSVAAAPTRTNAASEVEDFNSLIVRGDVAFQQSAYELALLNYVKASRLKPGNSMVRRRLEVVLTLQGRQQEARKYR
jgi:serine/threonine protein kinase